MNRRLLIAVLFLTMALLAFTLSSMAVGRGDSAGQVARASLRTMSGEFAHRDLACTGTQRGPSIFVPSDQWGAGPAQDRHARLHGSAAA